MSIAVFDKFVNGIPTAVFDGKDVSMVLLVDPPAELPPFFLANKGVLDTASKTIKVYDDTGNTVVHNFDIAGTDLTPINEAIAGLESRVGDNETNIDTLQGDVSTNTTNIGTNTSNIGDLQGRATALESTTSKHTTDIQGLQGATGTNASDISALTLRVGKNETDIAAVVITANAADTLSKQNKERLDNLPAPPSLEGYIKTGDDATLKSVSFGDNTKIDTQPDLGLVLQGDYIYGKADSGYEHFFVESGNFNVKSKKVQKVNDGQAEDDAVNLRQLGAVESKADAAQTTANAADTLSKSNQTAIGNLSTTVGNNTSGISTNAKDISDLSTKVDGVETTANAADTLSKTNKERLDGLPADVTPRVEALETNALQKDVNGYDAKSLKILNVASGEDTDTSVANIGDVKRISTEGSGLKPTENEWDMLTYPVTNIGTSDIETSAATVGQVNAVDSKADTNAGAISNLSTTVGQHDTQIGTNTSNIATVTSTANAADALSKDNKTRLDNLPPSPDLSGYVKNGDDVNFGTADINIVKVTKGNDPTKFSDILIDGNTNTQMNFVGDTHFYIRNKSDNSKGLEALQIDSSARLVAKQKIKTPIITNLSTGTTNSNTDKASFIDLTEDNVAKVGAKNSLLFDVGGNLSAGVYPDHVNFNTDYVTGVKMRDVGARQPYDAVNWETLQGFSPDLDGYARLDTEVQFSKVNIKNDFADDTKNPYIWCDPANGNTVYAGTGQVYFNRYDHDGTKHRWGIVDTSNRLTLDNAMKATRVNNHQTWTTVSSNDHAGFMRLDLDNRVILGAKQDVSFQVNGKDVYKVKDTGIDFTGLGGTATIHHDNNIDVSVGDTKNVAFKSNGMKLLAAMDADGKNINHSGDLSFNAGKKLKGSDVGNLVVQNLGSINRNHTNDANSVTLGNGKNTYKSNEHLFHDNSGNEMFSIGADIDANNRKLQNVAKSETDSDATNLGHVKELIAAGSGGGVEEWIEIANGTLASDGTRPTGASSDSNLNVWHNTVSASTTDPNNEFKIAFAGAYEKVKDWSEPLRYKLVQGDKVQYWTAPANGWVTNNNVWHLSAIGVSGDNLDLGVDTKVYASPYFIDTSVDYENYITRSQSGSTTFYETTSGQQNAWVVATDNTFQGAMTYTFDYSREGQEVVVGVENRTKGSVIAKLYSRQSAVLTVEVPSYHVFSARYVPAIGKYVYNIGSWYPTEQRVVTLDEINPTISSDYKQMTKNIIAAMPRHTTLIGYHNPDISGASKYKFVTTGATGTGKESSKCAVVIHKHIDGHAVGLSTTEGLGGGRVYSRVLDGSTGVWNTNSTSASRSVASEIELEGLPEDQIFFTGDQGILESYIVNEETGEAALRPLVGYNVPKHESDIAALEIQTEKNRSQTHYFINEGSLSYDWPDEARRPLVEVQVLNTTQTINNSSVTVTDNDTHRYSGTYNSVGAVAINSSGNWSVQYVYHNCYKKTDQDWYVVFNQGNAGWQIIEAANPHTSVGSTAASVTVQLGGQTSLPESFGNYTIDPNFDNIDSLEFLSAEVPVQYDDINSRVLINFNGAKPSGYVVLK